MPSAELLVVAAIGATITIAMSMIGGLRLHNFVVRYAPPLAAHKNLCVLAGLIVGLVTVALWLR